ncbi:MAG TPA: Gfo/Idh/MocA family oxidoreductase [Trebonia sp.]|nr:Gfo/Idh/MocA family oxidoreductase [Trebonia sp.]
MTAPAAAGPVRVGIIGAGNVSGQYLPTLLSYPDIEVRGIADLDAGRARAQAGAYGIGFAGSPGELLAIGDIELVLNLTTPAAHAAVALEVIGSGRHLWGEKPLALDRASARAVLAAASAAGVWVGNAPDTILGAGIQTAQRLLADGAIGTPGTVLTLMQGPGPESWHPRPRFLFARGAGPLFDIGPYYLTTLVQLLGPIASVQAAGHRARNERVIGTGPDAGTAFPVEVDTHVSVLTRFRSGVVGTSVYSFDSAVRRQRFEITGEHGVLRVPVSGFNEPPRIVRAAGPDTGWTDVPPAGEPRDRGVGVLEMARAIRAGRPPRASGQLAYHVLDVMLAIEESAATGHPVDVNSTAGAVPPLDAGWSSAAATLTPAGEAR